MKVLLSFLFVGLSPLALAANLSVQGQNLLTGEAVILNSDQKKPLAVVFLSAKCPCSNSHIPEIKSLAQDFPEVSFVAVHSNQDESDTMAKTYFSQLKFSFAVIQDEKAKLADQFQALKTPHAFLLSKEGLILYQGGISNSKDCKNSDRLFLREALEDLKANQKIRTPEGRTLGCAITRGDKNVWK